MGISIVPKTGFSPDENDLGIIPCPHKSTPTISYFPTRVFGQCVAALVLEFFDRQSAENFAANPTDHGSSVLGKAWFMQGEGVDAYERNHGRTETGMVLPMDWATHVVKSHSEVAPKTSEDEADSEPTCRTIGVQFSALEGRSCHALYNMSRGDVTAYSMGGDDERPWRVGISYIGDLYGNKAEVPTAPVSDYAANMAKRVDRERRDRKSTGSSYQASTQSLVDDHNPYAQNILQPSAHAPNDLMSFIPAQEHLAPPPYYPLYDPNTAADADAQLQFAEIDTLFPDHLQQETLDQTFQYPSLTTNHQSVPGQVYQGLDGLWYQT